jgi:hypothetical protein
MAKLIYKIKHPKRNLKPTWDRLIHTMNNLTGCVGKKLCCTLRYHCTGLRYVIPRVTNNSIITVNYCRCPD